jgi:hypothetical protein
MRLKTILPRATSGVFVFKLLVEASKLLHDDYATPGFKNDSTHNIALCAQKGNRYLFTSYICK